MLKILKYTTLTVCLALLIIGHSPNLTRFCFSYMSSDYGDLYRKCCLSKFNTIIKGCEGEFKNSEKAGGTNLFLVGDSYFAALQYSTARFKNVDNIYTVHWMDQLALPYLPEHSRNILILERVERTYDQLPDTTAIILNPQLKAPTYIENLKRSTLARNVTIESAEFTLDQFLFNDRFSFFVKGLKADFNQKYFNRIDDNVRLNKSGDQLLFYEETDAANSSFKSIDSSMVKRLVDNTNIHYQHYRNMGFDEIYFVVIPNKVSIIEPDYQHRQYNHLVEAIQSNPALKPKVIDMYSIFKKANEQEIIYMPWDTHWNCTGQHLFIDYVNANILSPDRLTLN